MLFGGGLVGLVVLGLIIFCVLDVIGTDESLIRNLPNKIIWLVLVIFLGPIGCVAWLVMGRPQGAALRPGDTTYRAPRGADFTPTGFAEPALDPGEHQRRREDALRRHEEERAAERKRKEDEARLAEWELDLARREEELRRREEGP